MTIRIIAAIPGVLMLLSGLGWLFDPPRAAAQLGMKLFDDPIGRSSQIGDFGAFFLATSAMALLGAITQKRHWLQAAAMLLGGAAVMRTLAWLLHDAAFATSLIAAEVVLTAMLLGAASQLPAEG